MTDVQIQRIPPRLPRKPADEFDSIEEFEKYEEQRLNHREIRNQVKEKNKELVEKMIQDYKNYPKAFKNLQEAKYWAVKTLNLSDETTFDDENLDLTFLTHFKRIYDYISQRYPQVNVHFEHLWTIEYENKWMKKYRYPDIYNKLIAEGKSKKEAQELAELYTTEKETLDTGIINAAGGWEIKTNLGKDFGEMIKAFAPLIESNYTCKGNGTIDNLFVHEFGHNIDAFFKLYNEDVREGLTAERNQFMREFTRKYKDRIEKEVSEYATVNDSELFAELFTEYILNPNSSDIVKEFGAWLDDMTERAKKEGFKGIKGLNKSLKLSLEKLENTIDIFLKGGKNFGFGF